LNSDHPPTGTVGARYIAALFFRSGGFLKRAILSLASTIFFFLCACSTPHESALAIAHVTVLDMTDAAPLVDQTVLIEKQHIAAIGPSSAVAIPRGAKIHDARGKFLMPGLADMHIHLTAAGEPNGSRKFMLPLLLANGITSVRDMGGYLESLIPLRKEIEEGKRLGPRIVTPGPYLDARRHHSSPLLSSPIAFRQMKMSISLSRSASISSKCNLC
jgi:imidazolonepropionase-like amidohydrolase